MRTQPSLPSADYFPVCISGMSLVHLPTGDGHTACSMKTQKLNPPLLQNDRYIYHTDYQNLKFSDKIIGIPAARNVGNVVSYILFNFVYAFKEKGKGRWKNHSIKGWRRRRGEEEGEKGEGGE